MQISLYLLQCISGNFGARTNQWSGLCIVCFIFYSKYSLWAAPKKKILFSWADWYLNLGLVFSFCLLSRTLLIYCTFLFFPWVRELISIHMIIYWIGGFVSLLLVESVYSYPFPPQSRFRSSSFCFFLLLLITNLNLPFGYVFLASL